MDKTSYALGMSIGHQLQQMNATELNIDDFSKAIRDIFAGKAAMSDMDAQAAVQAFFQQKEEEQAKAAQAEGEKFLKENAKKPGVVTLPSGLQYEVLREGDGKSLRLPTRWSATTRVRSSTVRSLTAVIDAARQPLSPSTRSLKAGQKACSSCRRVPSTASISLTRSATEPTVPVRPFRLMQH